MSIDLTIMLLAGIVIGHSVCTIWPKSKWFADFCFWMIAGIILGQLFFNK
jgi:uncharacterized membrane protein SirB2